MALVHGDVIEVACNLLEPSEVGGDQVQAAVEQLETYQVKTCINVLK